MGSHSCIEPPSREGVEIAEKNFRGTPLEDCTTVIVHNLPNNYNRAMLLSLFDTEGFGGLYDFVYLPIDFKTQTCLGYAFVNLVEPSMVRKFWKKFDGYERWAFSSKKVCSVSRCNVQHQGLEANIERYRNSPVMHPAVPDEYKPAIFSHGVRIDYPVPTQILKAPAVRRSCRGTNQAAPLHVRV